ncbi:hypothetical protein EJ06DRAFT_164133 [Trichodelitschia bisporula]|uniref:PARP catalytic domain-containing protein n=1 Tax=Trichodelitschia bisporula TaxID=703511 RepID=A0A6G1HMS7_9PEZI|nr:hypothetical protein EJ06DRAFT_164133 [Trichodelitschia bisporula]
MRFFLSFDCLRGAEPLHRQIEKIADGHNPADPAFPWQRVQQTTDGYIQKKSTSKVQLDDILLPAIRKFDRKDVAVAACCHALSQTAIQLLLMELKAVPEYFSELPTYLRILLSVHKYHPAIVDADEAARARDLLYMLPPMCTDKPFAFQRMLVLLKRGVPMSSRVYEHSAVLSRHICREFQSYVEQLATSGRLYVIHDVVSCLSIGFTPKISPIPSISLIQILESEWPSWRAWASWKPNIHSIKLYDTLENREREVFRDIIALDGPCFKDPTKPTLLQSIMDSFEQSPLTTITYGNFVLEISSPDVQHLREIIRRMKAVLFRAAVGSDSEGTLIRYLLVWRAALSERALDIAECCLEMKHPELTRVVTRLLDAQDKNVLPHLGDMVFFAAATGSGKGFRLREIFQPQIIAGLVGIVNNGQAAVLQLWSKGQEWTNGHLSTLTSLQDIRRQVEASPWLSELSGSPHRLFDQGLQRLFDQWPSLEDTRACFDTGVAIRSLPPGPIHNLRSKFDAYVLHLYIHPTSLLPDDLSIIAMITELWRQRDPDAHIKHVATLLLQQPDKFELTLVAQCIGQMLKEPNPGEGYYKSLSSILMEAENEPALACFHLAFFLTSPTRKFEYPELIKHSWRVVLQRMYTMDSITFIETVFKSRSLVLWFLWVERMGILFADLLSGDVPPITTLPIVEIHTWTMNLIPNKDMVQALFTVMGKSEPVFRLLAGPLGMANFKKSLQQILQSLSKGFKTVHWDVMARIFFKLSISGDNAALVAEALKAVRKSSHDHGPPHCLRILDLFHMESRDYAVIMHCAYLRSKRLSQTDRLSVAAVGALLGISREETENANLAALDARKAKMQSILGNMMAEAQNLEGLRMAFKAVDPEGVGKALKQLGIEDTSLLDDIMSELPVEMVDVVERIGISEVELQIPLSKLPLLQRQSLEVEGAENVLVRLTVSRYPVSFGFCIHFDKKLEGQQDHFKNHKYQFVFVDNITPKKRYCQKDGMSPVIFHLSQSLYKHLRGGATSLAIIYQHLTKAITLLGSTCTVCLEPHPHPLRHTTLCADFKCAAMMTMLNTPKSWLVKLTRHPPVLDLLVVILQSAACAPNGRKFLETFTVNNPSDVKTAIAALPPITDLQNATFTSQAFAQSSGPTYADLLRGLALAFPIYIVPATGPLRIPSIPPGTHQYLIANGTPEMEKRFAEKVGKAPTRVLFHGTSLDRVFAILTLGLREMSGTPLQANGAYHGKGIYLAEEPSTAWGYAKTAIGTTEKRWGAMNFPASCRVLLGCEVGGEQKAVSSGVHVIQDEALIMVRYIFVCPGTASMPVARHLTPAMASVFASLKSGAI